MHRNYTHRLAVVAYVIHEDKFLLLKRLNPPAIWGPPGGRLHENENPNDGVVREINEETGLQVRLWSPVDIWFGDHGGSRLVSIDYLATASTDQVELSDEHEAYCWSSIEDLRNNKPPLSKEEPAFFLKDFEKAWSLYRALANPQTPSWP